MSKVVGIRVIRDEDDALRLETIGDPSVFEVIALAEFASLRGKWLVSQAFYEDDVKEASS